MFNLDLIDLPVLERLDGEIRQYRTPEGLLYPSVTTVLGAAADKSGLDAWRKAVGEEEANRVSARAARRGTAVHSLCEKLVLNEVTFGLHSEELFVVLVCLCPWSLLSPFFQLPPQIWVQLLHHE